MSRSVNDMYKAIGLDMRVKAISNWIKGIPPPGQSASHAKAAAYQTRWFPSLKPLRAPNIAFLINLWTKKTLNSREQK